MVKIPSLSYYVGTMRRENMGTIGNIADKIYCRLCKQKTNHGYVKKHEIHTSQFPELDFGFNDAYYITKCLGCDSIGFLREYGDEDMFDRFGEPYTEQNVYPEGPQSSILETSVYKYDIKKFDNVPDIIHELYGQVVSCFELEHYLLAAVGLRMMIEGFCNDRAINEGYVLDEQGNKRLDKKGKEIRRNTLEGRINGMDEKRLITPVSAKILHQIRELGNATAHELEVPERSTIKRGLSIIEDLIRTVYEYQNIKI